MNPRPHWLSNVLCLAILAASIWLNTVNEAGWPEFAYQAQVTKMHKLYGWPFSFFCTGPRGERLWVFTPFILNGICWLALIVLPPWTLSGLLYRTLHIRLATAVALMLTASVLLWFFLNKLDDRYFWLSPVQRATAWLLIGSVVMSAVTLISERMMRREE